MQRLKRRVHSSGQKLTPRWFLRYHHIGFTFFVYKQNATMCDGCNLRVAFRINNIFVLAILALLTILINVPFVEIWNNMDLGETNVSVMIFIFLISVKEAVRSAWWVLELTTPTCCLRGHFSEQKSSDLMRPSFTPLMILYHSVQKILFYNQIKIGCFGPKHNSCLLVDTGHMWLTWSVSSSLSYTSSQSPLMIFGKIW